MARSLSWPSAAASAPTYQRTRATQVMLEVHTKGKGVCGVYNFEIAETKVAQVMGIAQQHQHPLLCTMEES